jgi:MYXO-CTERM domain-containing protein
LASTGLDVRLVGAGLALVAAALVVRRRRQVG